MRDQDHIPRMLQALGAAWMANPDLRLTQLVNSAASIGGWTDKDTFYCEDDVTESGLMHLIQGDVG